MPWQESCAVDLIVALIAEWRSGLWSVVELAERYSISRKTAYKWIARYCAEGPAGLCMRSSAPLNHGRATDSALVDAIIGQKVARPSWGPRKIIAKLKDHYPDRAWPAASTAGEILKKAGLVHKRRRRFRVPPTHGALTVAERPNQLWAVDHKGWVRLGDGQRCEPLTVTDSFSRYLIGLSAGQSTRQDEARPIFERAFSDYGLPDVIRSDNGPPFASVGVTGLTGLGVWWAKLGIRHERIAPGKPQQNGRHERFHLTLKEAMEPPEPTLEAQAARFATFQNDYNRERPHQALGQTPPARHYTPSSRPMPSRLPEPDYPAEADVRRVRTNGEIKWGGALLFVSSVLIGELVAIEEGPDGTVNMRFYNTPIATIDTHQRKLRRLSASTYQHQTNPNLSPTYPV